MDWKTISSFLGLVAVLMGVSYYFWDLDHKTKAVEEKLGILSSDLKNIKQLNQGPPGPKGERGPVGPQGEKGERGVKGLPGDPSDIGSIRKMILEEIAKKEFIEAVKEQVIISINDDTNLQVKNKNIVAQKELELNLREGQGEMLFNNLVSVGLDGAYNSYCSIRVASGVENRSGTIYPGTPWIMKAPDFKYGVSLISSTYTTCKLKVYRINDNKNIN